MVFSGLFLHPGSTHRPVRTLHCPFPLAVTRAGATCPGIWPSPSMGDVRDSQKSGTSSASPQHTHHLLSVQPRVGMHVPTVGGSGFYFLQTRVQQSLSLLEGGASLASSTALGGGREAISQPMFTCSRSSHAP